MKSGPVLKGWTRSPRSVSAAISPLATVVFPHPLWVPAITTLGLLSCIFSHRVRSYRRHGLALAAHTRVYRTGGQECLPANLSNGSINLSVPFV